MTGVPSAEEKPIEFDSERVAREEAARAEQLGLAADAIKALLSSDLSQEARHEVFALMLKERHGEAISVDRQSELGLQQGLGRSEELITSLAGNADGIAADAPEAARIIEQDGISEAS